MKKIFLLLPCCPLMGFLFVVFLFFNPTAEINKVSPTKAATQNTASLSFVRANRQGNAVSVNWRVAGNGIAGIVVEKTYQDPYKASASWEVAGNAAYTGDKSYTVLDHGVTQDNIHYRVHAVFADGNFIVSEPAKALKAKTAEL
ncbi:MAG: hypothetical protein ACXWV1_16050 [Chitinophagaceae bacterium]